MAIKVNGTTVIQDSPRAILNLETALSAAQGGTGLTSPGTSGNVLTSNGTTWTSAAGSVTPFSENLDIVAVSYTIATGKNAVSVGPMTINSGITVTVDSGQRWVVL